MDHDANSDEKQAEWINLRALRWAYKQDGLGVTAKGVLMSYALHANERGYAWPSVERIASRWGMDRETVRRGIDRLLARRLICRTKKRYGSTGQVKVYRLPKIAWGSGGKSRRFKNGEAVGKARDKRGISGGKSASNIEISNKEKFDDTRAHAHTRETVAASTESLSDAGQHPLWKNFSAFCKSRNGSPTLKGFNTWLKSQTPVKPKSSASVKDSQAAYEEKLRASMSAADREAGISER